MDSFELFLAQVDPAVVQAESFTGRGHRRLLAEVRQPTWRPSEPIPFDLAEIDGWRKRHPHVPKPPRPPVVMKAPRFTETQLRIAQAVRANNERKAS